jgi:hypothetical protein
MASYPLPKQALCKAVANGFTNETSWETIAMFNRQCDAIEQQGFMVPN